MLGQRVRARVILVLRECMWNDPAVSLVLPAFDDTGSLGHVVYPPGSTLGDYLPFPCGGNREVELKPTIFSSLLFFRFFLSFLFS